MHLILIEHISIPSGAIKSIAYSLKSIANIFKFQFLLVRLRAKVFKKNLEAYIEFQFLLVRLRDSINYSLKIQLLRISIPSGAIKSR